MKHTHLLQATALTLGVLAAPAYAQTAGPVSANQNAATHGRAI